MLLVVTAGVQEHGAETAGTNQPIRLLRTSYGFGSTITLVKTLSLTFVAAKYITGTPQLDFRRTCEGN